MITIVGLGPGDAKHLTREAWQVLENARDSVLLRTADHPAVPDLPCEWRSFDALYAGSADFQEVYEAIVAELLRLGQAGDVIYAVPGDPHVGEATTAAIEQAGVTGVHVVRGLSFIEPTLALLGVDALNGVQVYDAIIVAQYLHPVLNPDTPLLLGQLYSRMLASEVKLALMAVYPEEHPVTLIHAAGSEQQQLESLPLFEIDRSDRIGNLTTLYVPPLSASSLGAFAETIAYLRSPDGCPWDREQTPQSLRSSLLEEAAEVVDALDRDDVDDLREELGDLLLHIVMQTQMATEAGDFTLYDVIGGINSKIIRRHPHVWGDQVVNTLADLNRTWETIKRQEKGESVSQSVLDNVPVALPALARSQKIQRRVAKVGFEWPDTSGVYSKLKEELDELRQAATPAEQAAELGDILFVLVNLAKQLNVDAETALREANLKFERRFRRVEQLAANQSRALESMTLEAMERLWQQAKLDVG